MEVSEDLGVDVLALRRRYQERGGVIDRLDLPIVVFGGVCQLGFISSRARAGGSGKDGRGIEVADSGYGDRWGGREVRQHGRDRFAEESRPMTDHCGMHERAGVGFSQVVGELHNPLILVFSSILHGILADLGSGEGDSGSGHTSTRGANDESEGAIVGSFVGRGGWGRRGRTKAAGAEAMEMYPAVKLCIF